jgi:hypothetical protein
MTFTANRYLADIASRQRPVDPHADGSPATPLALTDVSEAPRTIERADASTFATASPGSIFDQLRSAQTLNRSGRKTSISPAGVPMPGGPV